MTKKFLEANITTRENLSLHAETFGKKGERALLLISGAGGPCRAWSDTFCLFFAKKGYFVIRFDQRDTGLSSAVDFEKKPYDLEDLALDIIDILNFYGVEKAHIIGHSMGGYVAQWLAATSANRVNKLVLIATNPIGEVTDYHFQLSEREKAISEETWQSAQTHRPVSSNFDESMDGFLKVFRLQNGSVDFDEQMATDYIRDLYFRSNFPASFHPSFIAVIEKTMAHLKERSQMLASIKAPTLVIHGKADTLLMAQVTGIPLALAIKDAELQLIPKMGHVMFNRELEKDIASRIYYFLSLSQAGEK